MGKIKLTKRVVEAIDPEDKDILLWDSEVQGFYVKITPMGRRVYTLYYRTPEGQQRRPAIGLHGDMTVDEARKIATEWKGRIAQGEDPSANRQERRDSVTFKAFAERYLKEYARVHKKKPTYTEDERMLTKEVYPRFGGKKLEAITRNDIQRFHAARAGSPVAANRNLTLLQSMFNLAERWGLRPEGSNPCKYVQRYKEESRKRFLNADELGRLAKALAEAERENVIPQSAINLVRLLLFTGCRLREIMHLEWANVDLANRCIHLADAKTGARTVYLNSAAMDILKAIDHGPSDLWVIKGRCKGEPLVNPYKPWRAICEKAGLEDLNMHDLRHSHAAVGVSLQMGLPIIGALLGHKQAKTTARYAHADVDPIRAASEAIGQEIQRQIESGSKVIEISRAAE